MTTSEIQSWINSDRDYDRGVILFKKYSKNKVLLKLFNRGETKKSRAKLELFLKKFEPKAKQIIVATPPKKKRKAELISPPLVITEVGGPVKSINNVSVSLPNYQPTERIKIEDLPAALQQRKKLQLSLYADDRKLFEALKKETVRHNRAEICEKLLAIREEITLIWNEIDQYLDNPGNWHLNNKKTEAKRVDPHRELTNLRSSISKKKKVLEKAIEQKKAHKIKKFSDELRGMLLDKEKLEKELR